MSLFEAKQISTTTKTTMDSKTYRYILPNLEALMTWRNKQNISKASKAKNSIESWLSYLFAISVIPSLQNRDLLGISCPSAPLSCLTERKMKGHSSPITQWSAKHLGKPGNTHNHLPDRDTYRERDAGEKVESP